MARCRIPFPSKLSIPISICCSYSGHITPSPSNFCPLSNTNSFPLFFRNHGLTGIRFTVKLGSDNWVFLNSSRVVNDLMEKRGAIYISRPKFPMTLDIVSGGGRIVLMPYDDTWRRLRKIMHQILSTRQSTTYQGYQDLESKQLLWDYLHVPEKWFLHNGRYSNSGIDPSSLF
jgi:cytochrome P450